MGQETIPHQSRMDAARKLAIDSAFVPCPAEDGDEIYPNGIFHFNITKMLEHINQNPGQYLLEEIPLENLTLFSSSLNEDYVSIGISPGPSFWLRYLRDVTL